MMRSLEELLAPVSDEHPCGPENILETDPELGAIGTELSAYTTRIDHLRQINTGQDHEIKVEHDDAPDWRAIVERCEAAMLRCKHLDLAVTLVAGWVRSSQLEGLHQGLELIIQLVSQYWDPLYPALDEDNYGRINALEGLAVPYYRDGDLYQMVGTIREIPLAKSRLGVASLASALNGQIVIDGDLLSALEPASVAGGVALVLQNVQQESIGSIDAQVEKAKECLEAVDQLSALLDEKLGREHAPKWDSLRVNLRGILKLLQPYATRVEEPDQADAWGEGPGETAGTGAQPPTSREGITGKITRKAHVRDALDLILTYYRQLEGHDDAQMSPVPLIIESAKATMDMNYRQVNEIFTAETFRTLDLIAGKSPSGE